MVDAPHDDRPTVGELLSLPPAWPREWAQRLGQEASRLGGRTEVRRTRAGDAWEVRWFLGRRPVLVLRPTSQEVVVELDVPNAVVPRLLSDPGTDEEFARTLGASRPVRGRRRLTVPLGSARRVNSLTLALRALAGAIGE